MKGLPRLVIDARKSGDAGIGTYIRQLLPRVMDGLSAHDPVLLTGPDTAWLRTGLARMSVTTVEAPEVPLSLAEQWGLRKIVRCKDVFWATSLAHPLGRRGPLVATVHDVAQLALDRPSAGGWLARQGASVYLRSLRQRAGLLLFNSEFTRREFLRCVGEPRGETVVTPLGVDPAWFEASPRPSDDARPYFICVGSIRPHKNLRRLLQAFGQVVDQLPHDLVLVGRLDGMRTREAGWQALLTPLGPRVRFLQGVDDATLRTWVAGATALVIPSLYEGFGLPLLEGLAAGCPVIASSAGALPEVGGDAASYVDPLSVEAMADALVAHAQLGPEQRRAWADRGQARARAFSWDRTAELTVQAMQRHLGGGG